MAENEDDVAPSRFFKVFLSETASESMAIPMSFNEHLEDPLPRKAKLQGTGEDHELKDGEFLTFVYDGHPTFEVSVFGHSRCKETRAVVETVELSDSDDEEEEVSQSIYPVDSNQTVSYDEVVARVSSMEVTRNPCFTTNLKQRTYELFIPANVVREHALTFGDSIKYIDAEGVMKGGRGKWSYDRVCFKGWNRICRRNRLREGDTVICEMLHVRKKVHSIKITVTRG
ncbi:hypothetical protein F2Q69_00061748 [Brassica cretica]|uniref:TF-B3 domain-containing protein n=1 Tax=Brassica cretica TaxID=69181 RepID=A0A8S9RLE1_BRACR|nr:hypothetical protein F2Q69_00061748 [Brassica cretica]